MLTEQQQLLLGGLYGLLRTEAGVVRTLMTEVEARICFMSGRRAEKPFSSDISNLWLPDTLHPTEKDAIRGRWTSLHIEQVEAEFIQELVQEVEAAALAEAERLMPVAEVVDLLWGAPLLRPSLEKETELLRRTTAPGLRRREAICQRLGERMTGEFIHQQRIGTDDHQLLENLLPSEKQASEVASWLCAATFAPLLDLLDLALFFPRET